MESWVEKAKGKDGDWWKSLWRSLISLLLGEVSQSCMPFIRHVDTHRLSRRESVNHTLSLTLSTSLQQLSSVSSANSKLNACTTPNSGTATASAIATTLHSFPTEKPFFLQLYFPHFPHFLSFSPDTFHTNNTLTNISFLSSPRPVNNYTHTHKYIYYLLHTTSSIFFHNTPTYICSYIYKYLLEYK